MFWPLKNDITPPFLHRPRCREMSSLPPKHKTKPQNLIPSSFLIWAPLGGNDCGGGAAEATKGQQSSLRMSSASHIRLSRPPPSALHLSPLPLFFTEKEATLEHEAEKNEERSNLSKYRLIFLARKFWAQWEMWQRGKRALTPRQREREKETKKITTCSFNFENFFSGRVIRP